MVIKCHSARQRQANVVINKSLQYPSKIAIFFCLKKQTHPYQAAVILQIHREHIQKEAWISTMCSSTAHQIVNPTTFLKYKTKH